MLLSNNKEDIELGIGIYEGLDYWDQIRIYKTIRDQWSSDVIVLYPNEDEYEKYPLDIYPWENRHTNLRWRKSPDLKLKQ